jgi:hypothetical protein
VARAVLLLVAALALAGCVEADETWRLAADGTGTYALRVRWDRGLLVRAGAIVGGDALRRLEGRGFPLGEGALRDTLAGLEGVVVEEVAQEDLEGGSRELRVRLRFRRLTDLLAWEVLARRAVRVRAEGVGGDDARAEWTMEPLRDVPVVAPLAAVARAQGLPPTPKESDGSSEPTPLERLGVRAEDGDLLAAMMKPALAKVRFRFRWELPGPVTSVGGRAPAHANATETTAATEVSFADLVSDRDRRVRVTWRPATFDAVPDVDRTGDAPPQEAGTPSR